MLLTPWPPVPVITTERLVMRDMTDDDIPAFFKMRSNEELMRYIDRPLAKTHDDVKQLLDKTAALQLTGEAINWGITLKGDDTLIGTIGYYRIDKENFRPEIGYLLDAPHQRKGIMTEAMKAIIAYGFNEMMAHTIIANIDPANVASRAVSEKLGFVEEAHFRENLYSNGKFLDTVILTLHAPK